VGAQLNLGPLDDCAAVAGEVLAEHTPLAYAPPVVIVETRVFTRRIDDLLSPEEYRLLQLALVTRPDVGKIIRGTGGLRKLRWAVSGRGKRGGARIIYFWHPPRRQLLMLFAFAKNEADDLTVEQRRALRRVVQTEYP